MADVETPTTDVQDESVINDHEQQFVSFIIGEENFAFPMEAVGEIIRVPTMVEVPLGPVQMLGLANLRGSVLPVYDLRCVLLGHSGEQTDTSRVVVVESSLGVTGFLVDRVARVYSVSKDAVDTSRSKQNDSSISYDYLDGLVKQSDQPIEQILNVGRLVEAQVNMVAAEKRSAISIGGSKKLNQETEQVEEEQLQQLVCFSLNQQEFAFHLQDVGEIVRIPDDISLLPDSHPSVLGLVNMRGKIIPIVDLSMNLGMNPCQMNDNARIIIVHANQSEAGSVGFVVERVSNVVSISPAALEAVPTMFSDGYSESVLEAVYRCADTKRLISIINLHNVFSRSLDASLGELDAVNDEDEAMKQAEQAEINEDDYSQYVIFWINGQEYGVGIEDTQEITRLPDKLESVPNTPDYLRGIVNLRGTVLPVIDLRSRLGMPVAETSERQRIVVLTRDKQRTGFIVDGVAEVKTVVSQTIESAPSLSNEQAQMLSRLIKLNDEQRIIQLIDPTVLLSDEAIDNLSVS
ncbi:chemotaxis protein CheW [Salinimonas lutimaris]|uniref:chemotaxis protein CheW n=1 Tax=Salinimonas lutimaris TaxID=914153 RepID=UPI0010C05727|nr:chemotaxis protein CheW [Salinimonas lutimaris]